MRISNPKLFNGQTLATKQQISAWLAGIDNTGFGTLSIPSANISGLSELATAVSTNATNISTISGALGTINEDSKVTAFGKIKSLQDAIKGLTGQEGEGNVLSLKSIDDRLTAEITGRAAADEYISGIVDTKADQATLVAVSGDLKTAIDLKAAQADLVTVSGKVNENATAISTLTTDYKAADAYISGIVDAVSGYVYGNVDRVVKSGAYIPSSEQLQLSFTSGDDVLIPVSALVDEYSSGNGITILDSVSGKNLININIKDGEKYLTVDADGLATTGISAAIEAAVSGKADKTQVAADIEAAVSVKADTVTVSTISSELNSAITGVASNLSTVSSDLDALEVKVGEHKTAIETAMQIVSVPLTAAVDKVEFDGVMCYSYAAPAKTTYILQVTSGGMAVGADISGTTVYVDSTDLAAAPALSALIAKPVVITTTPAE